ncbi:MAG: regulatory protein RecX [Clostridiales bacterium]|nr:regulatory protein RecX [Clostridiales bacterium]
MVITNIKKQRYNEARYNIYIDSKFCFSASGEDVIKYSLNEEKEIGIEELEELIRKCEETKAYNYALNLLSIKDYTSKDIKSKLKLKQYSDQTIGSVISRLELYKFVNDEEYVRKYIDYCLNVKKTGKNKIIYDLQNKGIKSENMEFIEIDEEIQYTNAYNLASKKLKSINNKTNIKDKIIRYLLTKGYDFDLIKKVMRNLSDTLGNDDD